MEQGAPGHVDALNHESATYAHKSAGLQRYFILVPIVVMQRQGAAHLTLM